MPDISAISVASTPKPFIGRELELEQLKNLYERRSPSLAVIKGRRRVGKSRLITELSKKIPKSRLLNFSGLAPINNISAQDQRDHFGQQLAKQLQLPASTFNDWTEAFYYLSHHLLPGDIVLFDEISWMGAEDPTFIPKLKAWWDITASENPSFLLVMCGSISTWIEKNILNSTAFFGRISLTITLEPLSIPESSELLKTYGFKGSPFEIYMLLSVLGGIPWYLEQVNPKLMAEGNIRSLFFQKDSMLALEFDRIFHDLFGDGGTTAKKILLALKEGQKSLAELRQEIQFSQSGTLSDIMSDLATSGFIQKHPQWSVKTGARSKQSLYRISDPYIRFYLKVIEPNRPLIEQGKFLPDQNSLSALLPGFDSTLGLQVELLLLQNHALLLNALDIEPSNCLWDGPYRQTKTQRKSGCQIDYLIQTKTKNLFIAEFKFQKKDIGPEILEEVQDRIKRFSCPRGFSAVPVLFHLGEVSSRVYDADYFYRVIDISNFL